LMDTLSLTSNNDDWSLGSGKPLTYLPGSKIRRLAAPVRLISMPMIVREWPWCWNRKLVVVTKNTLDSWQVGTHL
jgi:hypothetical protein